MSVCVSGVSAGVSVVLIKYTGNVWLQPCFYKCSSSLQNLFPDDLIISFPCICNAWGYS